MPWIDTGELTPESPLTADENYWIYNGLDALLTFEIHEAQLPLLEKYPEASLIYTFERAMQSPAMDMMRRGFLVDEPLRHEMLRTLSSELEFLERRLSRLSFIVWGKELNARSPTQLKDFFENYLSIPIPVKRFKGQEKTSLDRKTLESLTTYFYARPFISHILAIRDRTKSIGTLRSGVDADGRIRTSYNVASTETGRWSSSENAFGTGTNLQNITERLRRILIADPGYKIAYIDLEQAESRAVALLLYACFEGKEFLPEFARREAYLHACESGDLHTAVTMMTWPEKAWSSNDFRANRALADDHSNPFYRDYSLRDMSKRLGHGSNYRGSPWGMSQIISVDAKVIEAFQAKYFAAFPLKVWHQDVVERVQIDGAITTPLGRRRQFFGRRSDDATIREAIAFQPQSMVGDILNLGLWRVWNHYRNNPNVQLLAQVHDAIVIQYREHLEEQVLEKIPSLLVVPFSFAGRSLTIPCDIKTGWNFAKSDKKLFADGNPDGLIEYSKNDKRKRTPALSLLDRLIR